MPPDTPPSHPITERLWALSAAFHARLAHDLAALGLTVAEFRLVGEVMRSDGLRQSELAALLGVTAPTVSAAVQRLEKAGVLTREKDASDPRARVVRIAAGAPLETGLDVLDGLEVRAVASLSARQRAQLPRLLDRMTAALQLTE